jgi:signal transduction histidine kinase
LTVTVDPEPNAQAYAGELLDRVITNLIENAIEQNGAGIKVIVEFAETDGAVTLCVCDDGDGLSEGAKDTLFEAPIG